MDPLSTEPERAIQNCSDDKLDRAEFIKRLSAALINESTSKATGVVVGITGPWGSGKTSVLNLLREQILLQHPDAIVVRFDPWLISGRHDLIAEFLRELIGTIDSNRKRIHDLKKLGATFAQYGKQLAPVGNFLNPGAGALLGGVFGFLVRIFSTTASLNDLRLALTKQLKEIPVPIIALIDEIDRVEDDEIRAVAQLVRSVVDFPGISFVLAYDSVRVIQALGGDASENRSYERGRAYLEKIVQLQIPLPVIFDDEIGQLLSDDLAQLSSELNLPENFRYAERYKKLIGILSGNAIQTLRDIKRLVGTFRVLRGMLQLEVDWVDLLAYSTLLIKAPATVERMRREPDDYLDSPTTDRGLAQYLSRAGNDSKSDRLNSVIPETEWNEATKSLLTFLFPSLCVDQGISPDHNNAFSQSRCFLAALRLGLLPGAFSRENVAELISSGQEDVKLKLQAAFRDGRLNQLIGRIEELCIELEVIDKIVFWRGVGDFLRKPDCEWLSSFNPIIGTVRGFNSILSHALQQNSAARSGVAKIFFDLLDVGESELTALLIRVQIFAHGLFGNERRENNAQFLDAVETDRAAHEMTKRWREAHLSGRLIPCRWDLLPVFTMIDLDVWDSECRKNLDDVLKDDRSLASFSLMLFGGSFTTDKVTIGKMCSYDSYVSRVKDCLEPQKASKFHETVLLAFKKATGDGW